MLGLLLLIGAIIVFLIGLELARQSSSPVQVSVAGGRARIGASAPDFTTQRLDGTAIELRRLRGKPVLLNFWATWCSPCQEEMPLIQRATDRYGAAGLTVLAVDYQQTDSQAMRAFLFRLGVTFPAVYDPAGKIAAAYGVTIGLPTSVFIDRSGTVEFIQLGQMSDAVLEQHLRQIL